MTFELTTHYMLPCAARTFSINGLDADIYEFGMFQYAPQEESRGCAYHKFIPLEEPPTHILEKYNITESDFFGICQELEIKFDIGECDACS